MLAASVAGKFFSLPDLHSMDDHEVAHAIHVVQSKFPRSPLIYSRGSLPTTFDSLSRQLVNRGP
jgi:hypothetical protein